MERENFAHASGVLLLPIVAASYGGDLLLSPDQWPTNGPPKIAKPTVFQVVSRGIGKSFQSAITAPRMNLTGYGNATAQS